MGSRWQPLDHFVSLLHLRKKEGHFSTLSSSIRCLRNDCFLPCTERGTAGRAVTDRWGFVNWCREDRETTSSWILKQLLANKKAVNATDRLVSGLYLVFDSGDRGTFSVDPRDLWRWAAAKIQISLASALTRDLRNKYKHISTNTIQYSTVQEVPPPREPRPHPCWPTCCCCRAFPSVDPTARGKCASWADSSETEASSARSEWWCSPESGRWSCWPKTNSIHRDVRSQLEWVARKTAPPTLPTSDTAVSYYRTHSKRCFQQYFRRMLRGQFLAATRLSLRQNLLTS